MQWHPSSRVLGSRDEQWIDYNLPVAISEYSLLLILDNQSVATLF